MPKPLTKPPLYALTLTVEALHALASHPKNCKLLKPSRAAWRPGGMKIDIGISFGLLDQLKTAALPKENLSDTVRRIMGPK